MASPDTESVTTRAGNAQAWSWHSGFVEGAAKRQGHVFGLPDRGKSAK
jgi:hypothetical protein